MRISRRLRTRLRIPGIVAAAALLVTGLSLTSTDDAAAMPSHNPAIHTVAVPGFNPGMLISDDLFYNPYTMDRNAIQSFLNVKGAGCSGSWCLKNYRQNTSTRPADSECSQTYWGGNNESAAVIIEKVAQACSINPQALLVILQKEQSLVTRASASDVQYRKAMGYGCPDTAPCDTQYYGFFNQVYSAAHRFQYYRHHPNKFSHIPGKVNSVLYAPRKSCGSRSVYIQNYATAGLYNYTPYTPNNETIRGGHGSCSTFGNLNFVHYFNTWFGSTGTTPALPTARLGGMDRIATAVSISRRAFPSQSAKVYLAKAETPVDAISGGTLSDGPVLLVRTNGPVRGEILAEISRLNPGEVVALGGPAVVSDQVLADAAQGRATSRIFGPTRYETAIGISHHTFPDGPPSGRVYIANGSGADGVGTADSIASGMLADGPVFIVDPQSPSSINAVAGEIANLRAARNPVNTVVAIGGPAVVPDASLNTIANGLQTSRLSGPDRYGTSIAVASYVYPATGVEPSPGITRTVYITHNTIFADALAGGALTDGPVIFTPYGQSVLPSVTTNYLRNYRPAEVIALGGNASVHPSTLVAATIAGYSG